MPSSDFAAIVVAAGASRRMGFDKLTAPLLGRPLVTYSLAAFQDCAEIDHIVLVCAAERIAEFEALAADYPKVRRVVPGGKERAGSVLAGVEALDRPRPSFVAVHDGARPLIIPEAIAACCLAARESGASVAAEPVTDTLHRVDAGNQTVENVPRKHLWAVQTPQVMEVETLASLLQDVQESGGTITDEISLLIRSGGKAKVIETGSWNFKVTYPRDLSLAEMILKSRG